VLHGASRLAARLDVYGVKIGMTHAVLSRAHAFVGTTVMDISWHGTPLHTRQVPLPQT
jgi:hypothetical protein